VTEKVVSGAAGFGDRGPTGVFRRYCWQSGVPSGVGGSAMRPLESLSARVHQKDSRCELSAYGREALSSRE
jgi:hypothetical protein